MLHEIKKFIKRYSWIITIALLVILVALMFIQHSEHIQLKNEVREIKRTTQGNGANKVDVKTATRTKSLGIFKISYYCPCTTCCGAEAKGITATGTKAKGNIVAVDPSVIPLGSIVIIGGVKYRAEDTGGAIKQNRIDVLCGSHDEAVMKGIKYLEVEVVR